MFAWLAIERKDAKSRRRVALFGTLCELAAWRRFVSNLAKSR
ncbi:hypothetical protein RE6C_05571 [Rhodopirellula europaea 6C]|uniref:Uncharacterized protein n=1 Tax=Rhodopirellula europaea 6C TaxID=1263867 RepID=M2AVY4_9BACT|nr:hypothetical protein RE6C_05571 [Rhodopirellula europaea 6C]